MSAATDFSFGNSWLRMSGSRDRVPLPHPIAPTCVDESLETGREYYSHKRDIKAAGDAKSGACCVPVGPALPNSEKSDVSLYTK
ncbi:hypothetical protein ACU8KH_02870 [Lachancea thermotolerans]